MQLRGRNGQAARRLLAKDIAEALVEERTRTPFLEPGDGGGTRHAGVYENQSGDQRGAVQPHLAVHQDTLAPCTSFAPSRATA